MTHDSTSIEYEYWMDKARRHSMRTESDEPTIAELELEFQEAMCLPSDTEPRLDSALRHVLRHPGSLVRPRVVYQMARAYGIENRAAMDLGIALEYFHTASLIFDDMPAMDNASSRRGAPCVHVKYGESSAMLAALALINRAYALTWRAISQCPHAAQAHAMRYLEDRLGVNGLLNGQSLDLHYSELPHDRETTERVACGKTVSLIRLTLVLPAMLGGASARELQLFERMATCWGLAYQMVDDLKDVMQSSVASGKTAARDLHLDRPNIALAIGVPDALARLTRLIDVGDRTLDGLMARRPSLKFLRRLRTDLQHELRRVTSQRITPQPTATQRECTAAAS
ncbi:polyprenyl synthetase family protein [Occallatibacter riparius]|uniref:Polyprenyl synthetase family protein n=1 Tax=Occallatibacter riparius TaxID=1002689 RepID=A0A9J7BS09_9BACT|nr:polyprenyl synthetase family protein [Occallatibacter riparius]UWZ85676.1 polyprenyl synthetase family protein [Occallatibacter riparius]